MNYLIPVEKDEQGNVVVSGRELHDFLEINTPYTQWFERMVGYGFDENVDFIGLSQKSEKPIGGRPQQDHALTLDMAKEISMIQRTERGKQARQYFLEVEKRYKQQNNLRMPETPLEIMSVVGKITERQDKQLKELNTKVTYLTDLAGLTSSRNKELTKARNKRVIERCGGAGSNAYKDVALRKKVYHQMFQDYKEYFDVNQYTDTPMKRFDEAKNFITNWHERYPLEQEIKRANEQTNLEI
ncbi:ORF6C domain-containing protein [Ligilactobacillus murinus]|uniref:ORF6C domain-containing protein n=1 Tax=Ligilactobacillus murinus TaxID=1622 RepID=UPI001094CC31|nr:ORF6C domain-containing protein [Ligilactobacillus murinus]TGY52347.1 phage antirepressor Ant [Ligilactobacillus murinus]